MEESDENPARTAIIVVEGVGDQQRPYGSENVYRELLKHEGARWEPGGQTDDWYPGRDRFGVRAGDPQPVTRYRLRGRTGERDVDVYEFYWADLTRFASATRAFVISAYALFLDIGAIGHAALGRCPRGLTPEPVTSRPSRRFGRAASILAMIEWVLAGPIVLTGAALIALLGAGVLALAVSDAGSTAAVDGALAAYALVACGLTARWIRSYSREWRGVAPLAALLIAAAIGLTAWRIVADGGHAVVGVADALLYLSAYAFRSAWLAFGVLAAVYLLALAAAALEPPDNQHRGSRAGTAMLSLSGSVGVGLLTAIIAASIDVAFQAIASRPFPTAARPSCLATLSDWTLSPCPPSTVREVSTWALTLFGQCLVPLALTVVLAGVFVTLAAIGAAARHHRFARARPGDPRRHPANVVPPVVRACVIGLIAVVPFGVLVLLAAWLPVIAILGAPFKNGAVLGAAPHVATVIAAIAGYAAATLIALARLVGLGTSGLGSAPVNPGVRSAMNDVSDVLSFLREPARGRRGSSRGASAPGSAPAEVWPRQVLLNRFAALLDYVDKGGSDGARYDRVVFVAHSQGTVITTALLAIDPSELSLPPQRALVTFGSPLRNLMLWRFREQFAWVGRLGSPDPDPYVIDVDLEWLNFGADADFVGRSVFGEPSDPPTRVGAPISENSGGGNGYTCQDISSGAGGHGSYWTSDTVFHAVADLASSGETHLVGRGAPPAPRAEAPATGDATTT